MVVRLRHETECYCAQLALAQANGKQVLAHIEFGQKMGCWPAISSSAPGEKA